MKKIPLILLIILPFQVINAQSKPFKIKNLKDYVKNHQSFAILPFNVNADVKELPEGVTMEMIEEGEKESGLELQTTMYTYLSQKLKRKNVEIQDVDKTNRILKKNNIDVENLLDYEPSELAEFLGVNAVFVHKVNTTEPLTSKERQINVAINAATTILIGRGLGAKSKANINSRLYDAKTDKLIWSWDKDLKGGVTDADRAIKNFISAFININPYKKS